MIIHDSTIENSTERVLKFVFYKPITKNSRKKEL